MTLKFSQEDAQDMTRIIQRARPNWSPRGIINALQIAARDHAAGPTLTAALRAACDPYHPDTNRGGSKSPDSILFDKYWTPEPSRSAPTGRVMCVECLNKHAADEMQRGRHGWTCNDCKEKTA